MTQSTLEGYRLQFSLGSRSLMELLNTENEFLAAKTALMESQIDELIAQFRLLNGLGYLVKQLEISLDIAGFSEA